MVNRCDVGGTEVRDYARREGLTIVAEIPHDRAVAEAYARGALPCDASRELHDAVAKLADRLTDGGGGDPA